MEINMEDTDDRGIQNLELDKIHFFRVYKFRVDGARCRFPRRRRRKCTRLQILIPPLNRLLFIRPTLHSPPFFLFLA